MGTPGELVAFDTIEARPPTSSDRLQLDFIDGLRALAALYIVFHHAFLTADYLPSWLHIFRFGFEVVAIFITISGFCLALPLARRGEWTLETWTFYRRRARRILPPYYAALGFGLLLALFYSIHSYPQDYLGVPLSWKMVWSHVVLLQNWFPDLSMTVDGPLWSIAVECQIYLLFPLILIARRRLGRWFTLALCFAAAEIMSRTLDGSGYLGLLFLFAVGMLGADLSFRPRSRPWLLPCAFICVMGVVPAYEGHRAFSIGLLGTAIALLMAYLTQVRGSFGNKILGWKPLAWIGTFSYSIYLTHAFVDGCCTRWLSHHSGIWRAASPAQHTVVHLFLFIPVILLLSFGFYIVFERPFVSSPRRRAEDRLHLHAHQTLSHAAD